MIIITVTSEIVEITRSFRKDRPSITWLKRIKKLHDTARGRATRSLKDKPKRSGYKNGWEGDLHYVSDLRFWRNAPKNIIPIKVEIIHQN